MSLIRIENLEKEYNIAEGKVIPVNGVSLEIERGEFVAIMGPSGSGKTTLLNLVGGLDKPDKGKITVDEIDLSELSKHKLADYRREYVGFVFQGFNLIPTLTVFEKVLLPSILKDEPLGKKKERVAHLLKTVGLENKADRLIMQLSGGEQQRVAIARALINEPLILIADEPTGNLDSKTGEEILQLFSKLNKDGMTIIMVTHNKDAAGYSNRVVRMKDGKIYRDVK